MDHEVTMAFLLTCFLALPVGFNPVWNENFKFVVRVPDLALVRFVVEDYDSTSQNDLVGQYTLPFSSMLNGESSFSSHSSSKPLENKSWLAFLCAELLTSN